jgi:hypothetical protein
MRERDNSLHCGSALATNKRRENNKKKHNDLGKLK